MPFDIADFLEIRSIATKKSELEFDKKAVFKVLDYVSSNPPGKDAKFSKIKKTIVFYIIHKIQEPLEFCEYQSTFARFIGETVKKNNENKISGAKRERWLMLL